MYPLVLGIRTTQPQKGDEEMKESESKELERLRGENAFATIGYIIWGLVDLICSFFDD